MKRNATLALAALSCFCGLSAQTLHVENGAVSYNFPAAKAGEITFTTNDTITALGKALALNNDTKMWVDNATVEDNVVTVTYNGTSARVDVAGNIARYIDATVTGGQVSITQSAEVADTTCGEITYRLAGEATDGSFYLAGSYKSTLELHGVNLTSSTGAALDIQNGKRIALKLIEGTSNKLTDAANGSQKGCIVCKGHLEFKGKGELSVAANTAHGIYAKEYIEMKNCTISVTSSVKDGVNCNQYFLMESGSLSISGTGDDGLQVSYKDDTDREAEDTGSITILDGTINVEVSADAAKGLKCDGAFNIKGGDITVTATGQGVWDTEKVKTKAAACLASDGDMTIDGGKLNLTATGGGGKGLNVDTNLIINSGDITIKTSGGIVAYVNNTLNTNYTGNTDNIESDYKSSPKGIKADGNIDINGGTINVTTTGNGGEGIESKAILTVNNGNITIASTDDGMNSSSHMYIKGGNITVVASGNDGLDANGNLYIEGGYIMAFGASAPEGGIDANEEEGYTVIFTGGTLLAVGGNSSLPSSSSGSTQPYVSGSGTVSANTVITLTDSNGTTLATFTAPANYTGGQSGPGGRPAAPGGGGNRPGQGGGSVIITCPGLTSGSSYNLAVGTTTSSVTAQLTGSSSGPGGSPF